MSKVCLAPWVIAPGTVLGDTTALQLFSATPSTVHHGVCVVGRGELWLPSLFEINSQKVELVKSTATVFFWHKYSLEVASVVDFFTQ